MSYEGFQQWLCQNGHYHEFDAYDTPDEKAWRCPDCSAPLKWRNSVDDTNGECAGYEELEEKTPRVMCACPACGVEHVREPATYYAPNEKRG